MCFCHLRTQSLCLTLLYLRAKSKLCGGYVTWGSGTEKGFFTLSSVKSPQLLDPRKMWYVLSNGVCGDCPPIYFSRNNLPAHFPESIVRIKRSALQTLDGGPFQGKASSEDEIITSSFGLIAIFLRHAPVSQLFHDDIFEHLRCFLNSLDLSICEDQAIGTST